MYDNEAVQALLERLPLSLDMSEMNGNEKFYFFSDSLPVDSQLPTQVHAGDLMLYGSDCLVLFYKTFTTSYRYTPLGYMEDAAGLAEALGGDSVQVSFEVER